MILYLIKSSVCLLLLLAVYYLLLEREKFHHYKRYYLLCCLTFSFTVPFAVIKVSSPAISKIVSEQYIINNLSKTTVSQLRPANTVPFFTIEQLMFTIYIIVTLLFMIRYLRNIMLMKRKMLGCRIISYQGAKLVVAKEQIASCTFLNYIFISQHTYENKSEAKQILLHELTHARQMHTLDILFIELLRVFFWFNPVLYLYKKAVQLNHEFIADDTVVKTYNNGSQYQALMLSIAGLPGDSFLSSSFNYSVTRKRLLMIRKAENVKLECIKQWSVIPLVVAAIFIFSSRLSADQKIGLKQQEKNCLEIPLAGARSAAPGVDTSPDTKKQKFKNHSLAYVQKDNRIVDKIAARNKPDSTAKIVGSQTTVQPKVLEEFTNGIYVSAHKIRLSIDRTTTRQQLQEYADLLLKNNILLEIDKVGYSSEGNISSIKITVVSNGFTGKIDRPVLDTPAGFSLANEPEVASGRSVFNIF